MAKFNHKNLFNFTAFAALTSVGLGLAVAGCSNGSDSPSAFDRAAGTVTYNYTKFYEQQEANKVCAKNYLPNQAVKATFTFTSASHEYIHVDDSITIGEMTEEECYWNEGVPKSVKITGVPITAKTVSVVYYDASDDVVGFGVDTLDWQGDISSPKKEAVVDDPDFTHANSGSMGAPTVMQYPNHIDKGEFTWVKLMAPYTRADGTETAFDLSHFAGYDLKDVNYVEKARYAASRPVDSNGFTPGYFKGLHYGIQPVDVTFTGIGPNAVPTALSTSIYVTDAELVGMTLTAVDGRTTVAVPDETMGETEVKVDGSEIPFYYALFAVEGNYVSENGNPSFNTSSMETKVDWSLSNTTDFSGVVDGLGRYRVEAKNSSSVATATVTAKSGEVDGSIDVKSLPAKAKLAIDLDNSDLAQGETVSGSVVGNFSVTTESGTQETADVNLTASASLVVESSVENPSGTAGDPDVFVNENQLVLDSTNDAVGDVVTISASYEGDKATITADPVEIKIVSGEDPEEPSDEASEGE